MRTERPMGRRASFSSMLRPRCPRRGCGVRVLACSRLVRVERLFGLCGQGPRAHASGCGACGVLGGACWIVERGWRPSLSAQEILEADVTMESKPIVASIAEADGDVEMDGAGEGPGSERSVMEDIRRAFFRLTGRDEEEKAGEGAAEAGPVKEEPKVGPLRSTSSPGTVAQLQATTPMADGNGLLFGYEWLRSSTSAAGHLWGG